MTSTIKTAVCMTLAGLAVATAPSAHADILGQYTGQLAVSWWKWALQTPAPVNPLLDNTGASCAQGQSGLNWFLAGTLGTAPVTRSCTVPFGRILFFPLVNSFYGAFLNDAPETRTEAYVRAAASCTVPTDVSLTIDNIKIYNPKQFFTGNPGSLSPLFDIQLPVDNVYGVDSTTVPQLKLSPAAEQGYYFYVPGLLPGKHTIHWVATGCAPGAVQDITYKLTISLLP